MTSGLFILLLLAAEPQAPAPEAQDSELIDSEWSLGDPATTKPRRVRNGQAAGAKAMARRKAKPRLFGGARVSNSGRRSKGGANVGVAVPF